MARLLNMREIVHLTAMPRVRRIAVENFLGTLDNTMPKEMHLLNLRNDAASYRWNIATVSAIKKGIEMMYKDETRDVKSVKCL